MEDNIFDKVHEVDLEKTMTVSYTHLDVYKRQTVHSVNVLRQRVKVIVEINDEKEIQEFPVDELKFKPRKKKVKVSDKELKELGNLEDKKGDSKLND